MVSENLFAPCFLQCRKLKIKVLVLSRHSRVSYFHSFFASQDMPQGIPEG